MNVQAAQVLLSIYLTLPSISVLGQKFHSHKTMRLLKIRSLNCVSSGLSTAKSLNLGIGLYSSGQIHIDTQGYRTWGPDLTRNTSMCNF